MGSPLGHVSVGVSMLVYGLWWASLSCLIRDKNEDLPKKGCGRRACRVNPQEAASCETKGRSWLPQPYKPQFPLEPIIRLLITGIGLFLFAFVQAEGNRLHFTLYRTEFNEDGQIVSHLIQFPHIILHLGFFLSAVVDIASLFTALPLHTSQVFFSLAFFCEGVAFFVHIQGRERMGIYTHEPIIFLALICAMLTALRALGERKFAINFGLAYCLLLQGTWFIQVGYLLFPADGTKWILPCPEVPSSIKWRVKTESDLQEYLATQIEDSAKVAHCAAVGSDDNTALLVSFCLATHVLAVAVFVLLFPYVVQLVVMKMQLYGRCLRRQDSHCRTISAETYNSVGSESSSNEDGPASHKTTPHSLEQTCNHSR